MKKLFLILVPIIASLLLFSCEKNDLNNNFEQGSKTQVNFKNISFLELRKNERAIRALDHAIEKQGHYLSRNFISDDYGVFVDTSQIVMITNNGTLSYTFRILVENEEMPENLILNQNELGEFTAYKASYSFTQEELNLINDNNFPINKTPYSIVEMDKLADFQRDPIDTSGPCIRTSSLTYSVCHPSDGSADIIYEPNTYSGGCKRHYDLCCV